nr:2-isopropylmalate synthase [uncultured Holophaga sp.]
MQAHRYAPLPPIQLADRQWPSRVLSTAPAWCSVDLRDGNQALVEPMGWDRKLRLFETLVARGFREIEVGFPAASQTDFDFIRRLIEEDRIPEGVTLQVLTQAREELIQRTVDALQGARRVIIHLYNSTSTLQRRVVFDQEEDEILALAVRGTRWVKEAARKLMGTELRFEYSPESFSGTELDFAARISQAVIETWDPRRPGEMILNLPNTVEQATPNRYADQIEWMHRNLKGRERVVLSVHTHNDRGCAVAATELALLAGADRVEGTLFGNGERTGNADLVTLGLNLLMNGIDPGLDLGNLPELVEVFETCNRLPLGPRHPYAGELVFTAFSGSHQDAIKKGLAVLKAEGRSDWEVPYLPLDPAEVGRSYEAIIRINSQSGKGGLAYLLEAGHGFILPRSLAAEFSAQVQAQADRSGEEIAPDQVWHSFESTYLQPGRYTLPAFETQRSGADCHLSATLEEAGHPLQVSGSGKGPLEAFVKGINQALDRDIHILDYHEHALGSGEEAEAVAYVHLRGKDGQTRHGVGRDTDIAAAGLRAILSALNRL